MYNAKLNYEQDIIIDTINLMGIYRLSAGYDIPETNINAIGMGYRFPTINGPLVGNVSLDRFFVTKDFFRQYLGEYASFDGNVIDKKTKTQILGFNEAYVTSHSVSSSVGSIPTTSTQALVVGNIGGSAATNLQRPGDEIFVSTSGAHIVDAEGNLLVANKNDNLFEDVYIPNQGSIKIECDGHDGFTFNRVVSFDYNTQISREPMFIIGKKFPVQVNSNLPISVSGNFSIEYDELLLKNLKDYFSSPQLKNIKIQLFDSKGYPGSSLIESYNIPNARLVGHELQSSANGKLEYSLSYVGYFNAHPQ